jgi:hypothetical protein
MSRELFAGLKAKAQIKLRAGPSEPSQQAKGGKSNLPTTYFVLRLEGRARCLSRPL